MKFVKVITCPILFSFTVVWKTLLLSTICLSCINAFTNCHDDGALQPDPGILDIVEFTWLGNLQYVHVKKGTPHYYRAPRVVLVHRRYALSTALDAADVPDGYALGNVVFGEYEKDESECELSKDQYWGGQSCDPTVLIMPIADVLVHPEFKHFKVKHSLALLKLIQDIKSEYLLPVCLPAVDFVHNSEWRPPTFFYIDYLNSVPRDYVNEMKNVLDIYILPNSECVEKDSLKNSTLGFRHGCSKGCGMRSGAPSVVHEHTGHWTLVALAQGGPPCPDPLRRASRKPRPPRHTLLLPYVPWISAAIAGLSSADMYQNDPFGVVMPRSALEDYHQRQLKRGWVGKWWMGSIMCYTRGEMAKGIYRCYKDLFTIVPSQSSALTYRLQIYPDLQQKIICVKVAVTQRMVDPKVWWSHNEGPSPEGTIPVMIELLIPPTNMRLEVEVEAYAVEAGYNINVPINESPKLK